MTSAVQVCLRRVVIGHLFDPEQRRRDCLGGTWCDTTARALDAGRLSKGPVAPAGEQYFEGRAT
ncbi:hypothetical protein ABTZ57_26490 [Streptomyces sp. NPDC094048]|uniref:hypothetical protein n=1 Tax=Streptomyces sp. NPDC094048 TaxID=3155207 RepID=UPI003323D203